jgi:hypothetical protein
MPGRRPTWAQLRRFCERKGFRPSTTDHDFYDKVMADGSTAGTKISFNVTDTEPIPSSLWPRIWKRQLRLKSEEVFWQGLEGGTVEYDNPLAPEPRQPLPEYLIRHLRDARHWPADRIAATSTQDAQQQLNEWYSQHPPVSSDQET